VIWVHFQLLWLYSAAALSPTESLEDHVRLSILSACFAVLSCATLFGQTADQQATEQYIRQCEAQWAEDTASGKTENVQQFLAEDFIGVDTSGKMYDKKKEIQGLADDAKHFVSNHVNEIKIRFFGDTAVAQGSESWVGKEADGKERRGRFVWTDTWVKRDGKWQVVAAEDLAAPDK
jgi:ketosteroid isomerase-like protein